MAISLPLLQKRWRRVPDPLFLNPVPRRDSHVLHGAGAGPNADHWRPRRLQNRPNFQRNRVRSRGYVLLDEHLLHRYPRLGHFLLFRLYEEW